LYNGKGTFLQVIEGGEKEIDSLYEKIKVDNRHHRVAFIGKKRISNRNSPNWKMGFKNIGSTDINFGSNFFSKNKTIDYIADSSTLFEDVLSHFKNKTQELVF